MNRFSLIMILAFVLTGVTALAAEEARVVYYVVPIEKGTNSKVDISNPAAVKSFPMMRSNLALKVLFYLEPMERMAKSYTPKQDSMGMDYLSVIVDESSKKLLFYVSASDKTKTSPKSTKDTKGLEYLPVYSMIVTIKE